jgi:hypothetical protein
MCTVTDDQIRRADEWAQHMSELPGRTYTYEHAFQGKLGEFAVLNACREELPNACLVEVPMPPVGTPDDGVDLRVDRKVFIQVKTSLECLYIYRQNENGIVFPTHFYIQAVPCGDHFKALKGKDMLDEWLARHGPLEFELRSWGDRSIWADDKAYWSGESFPHKSFSDFWDRLENELQLLAAAAPAH